MHAAIAAQAALAALSRAASTATPTPTPAVDPNLVTPGPWGFVAIAFVALAVVLLVWDMMRRIRRARIRSEIDEMLDAEEAAARGDDEPRGTTKDPEGQGQIGSTAMSRLAVQWHRNASTVQTWKISWKPKCPGHGLGRFIP